MSSEIYLLDSTWSTKLGEYRTRWYYRLVTPPATIPAAAAIIEAFDLLRLPLAHVWLADSAKVEILRCRRILPTVGRPEQLAARLWDGLIPLSETALQVGARFVIRSADPAIKRAAWFTLYGLDYLAPGPVAWRALPQQVAMSAFAYAMAQPLTAPVGPFEAVLQHRSSTGINGSNTYGTFTDAGQVYLYPSPIVATHKAQKPKGSANRVTI